MADGDAELAKRAAKGDQAALEALYHRYVHRVWRYAWLRTNSRDAAADVVQDTFLRVLRSIDRFKGSSTFATWLFAVTRSAVIERARRLQRDRCVTDEPGVLRLVPTKGDPPDRQPRDEARGAVRQAIAELPGAQRDAIVLCELSGLSIRDAAGVLDWGESRVKVTLFRARRKLRDLLRELVTDDDADKRQGKTET